MSQEQLVLRHMKVFPGIGFTAKDIYRNVLFRAPYTSTVRALSNLVSRGLIVKTSVSKVEEFGRANRLFMVPR